jgi:hypothetical protein
MVGQWIFTHSSHPLSLVFSVSYFSLSPGNTFAYACTYGTSRPGLPSGIDVHLSFSGKIRYHPLRMKKAAPLSA